MGQPTDNISIVSLLPSATEILCGLGLQSKITGVSHECDYPEEIVGLPVLSRPKIDPSKSSKEIDTDVRSLVKQGLSVYEVDVELLEKLQPDLVVTQDQCEVCAVSLSDVEAAVSKLSGKKTAVCSLNPNCLEDISADIRRIATATGTEDRGEALISSMNHRMNPLKSLFTKQPRVVCLEWLEPPMVAGGWIPELVKIAGGDPVIVSEPKKFRTVNWDEIVEADPDFVVLMPCGFSVDKTRNELRNELISKELRRIRSVPQGRCYIVDGNAYFNRPGPRIADSCEILAALIHPEKCSAFLSRYRNFIAQWPQS